MFESVAIILAFKKHLYSDSLHPTHFTHFKCVMQWLLVYSQELGIHYHHQFLDVFITSQGNRIPLCPDPPNFPSLPSLTTTYLFLSSTALSILDISGFLYLFFND